MNDLFGAAFITSDKTKTEIKVLKIDTTENIKHPKELK